MRILKSLLGLLLVLVLGSPVRGADEQFVDLKLDPTALTTAPFSDISVNVNNQIVNIGPGVTIVPAPGPGLVLIPTLLLLTSQDTPEGWSASPVVSVSWGSSAGPTGLATTSGGMVGMASTSSYPWTTIVSSPSGWVNADNAPLVISTSTVMKSFSPSLVGVDQGTKTFTFTGTTSAFTPGMQFSLAGPGVTTTNQPNSGTYTVVSSTPNNDHTNPSTAVVVSESIPSPTVGTTNAYYPLPNIVGADPNTKTLTFANDLTSVFAVGVRFKVAGSTGNDDPFTGSFKTVVSSSFHDGVTDVVTRNTLGSSVADGFAKIGFPGVGTRAAFFRLYYIVIPSPIGAFNPHTTTACSKTAGTCSGSCGFNKFCRLEENECRCVPIVR